MKKRLALLLTLVMVFTCMPMSTFAAVGTEPDSLEVCIKYADSNEYKSVKTFNLDYFKSNSKSAKYAYSDSLPTVAINDAKGVEVSKIIADAGIKLADVKTLHVSSTDGAKRSYNKSTLFQDAYYFSGLEDASNWKVTSNGIEITNITGASKGKVKVNPMFTYEENYYRVTGGPGKTSGQDRFRLTFGMEDLTTKKNGHVLEVKASSTMRFSYKLELDLSTNDPDGPSGPTTPNPPYPVNLVDIDNSWAKEYIVNMAKIGAITGNSKNQFLPKKNVSRAEFATMLIKTMVKSDILVMDSSANLADANKHWGKPYLSTAVKAGIIKPSGGKVYPDRNITRQEMATMIARGLELAQTNPSKKPTDDKDIESWAKDAVYAMLKNGGITGYPDGSFKPKNLATKEQAATMIWRSIVNEGYTPQP